MFRKISSSFLFNHSIIGSLGLTTSKRMVQNFKRFLVIDFEATCDNPIQMDPMEIIEFPVLVVDGESFQIQHKFHRYVKPKINPQLTNFCINLTGILQETADNSNHFDHVFNEFVDWMVKDLKLLNERTLNPIEPLTVITCGNWDLSIALYDECRRHKVIVPSFFRTWIDLKKAFRDVTGSWPKKGLSGMMQDLNIQPVGRPHSGIDDCFNTLEVVKELANRGHVYKNTNKIS